MALDYLSRLTPKSLVNVVELLPHSDKCSLGSTNSKFHTLLAPYIFKAIKISNNKDSVDIAPTLVGRYGRYITQLYFQGFANLTEDKNWEPYDNQHYYDDLEDADDSDEMDEDGEDEEMDDADDDDDEVYDEDDDEDDHLQQYFRPGMRALPAEIAGILSGRGLPRLSHVRVEFVYDFNDLELWSAKDVSTAIYLFIAPEPDSSIEGQELDHKWRALMAETWAALAANSAGIKRLDIWGLPTRATSTFFTDEWRQFLGKLDELEIKVLGFADRGGMFTNFDEGFKQFVSRLDKFFYNHLRTVRRLALEASLHVFVGLDGLHHGPLALRPSQMPILQKLELTFILIAPELVEFLVAHARVLKTLDFDTCACSLPNDGRSSNGITWSTLFRRLKAATPSLTQLIVTNERYGTLWVRAPYESRRFIALLREAPRVRKFAYGGVDPISGAFRFFGNTTLAAFKRGDDQRDYEALMELVQNNAKHNEVDAALQ